MNKNFKVFKLQGLSGILLLGFMAVGVLCGFVLSPIWVLMIGWNEIVGNMLHGPVINYYQASLLWIFLALCTYLVLKNSISIKIHTSNEQDCDEIDKMIKDSVEEENTEETKVQED